MMPRQQLLVGSATGLLLGVLLGLSAAPVVAAFIGGLTALLMALFSAKQNSEGSIYPYVVFAFALCSIGGVTLGIATRTHSWLSPDLRDSRDVWLDLGYSKEQARDLATYEHLGLLLIAEGQHQHFSKIGEPSTGSILHSQNASQSSDEPDDEIAGCKQLRSAVYSDLSSARSGMQAAGRMWNALVKVMDDHVNEAERLRALLDAKDSLCAK